MLKSGQSFLLLPYFNVTEFLIISCPFFPKAPRNSAYRSLTGFRNFLPSMADYKARPILTSPPSLFSPCINSPNLMLKAYL